MAGIGAEALEHLVGGGANHGSMLADIEASADESKDAHLPAQPEKIAVSDRSIAVPSETGIDELELGRQLVRRSAGSPLVIQRRGQPPPDATRLAPTRCHPAAGTQ